MDNIRDVFLQTAESVTPLLASPAVAARWDGLSALEEFSVRGLAGHLGRATSSVSYYLDRGPASGDAVSTADYYSKVVEEPDIFSDLHLAIRERGEQYSAHGHEVLITDWESQLEKLRLRLQEEPAGRLVEVYKQMILLLDDYLATRIVELAIHADDLAVSVDEPVPPLPPAAYDIAIQTLVDVARLRHGDLAVLRALSRRERDTIQALRVL